MSAVVYIATNKNIHSLITVFQTSLTVAGGDGELGCLCGKAGTIHLCDGSAHSSGCVVNGYGCLLSY